MSKPIPIKHQKFIDAIVDGRTAYDAYMTTIGNKNTANSTARSKGSRFRTKYQPQIDEAVTKRKELIAASAEKKVVQNALKRIFTTAEVDALLCETMDKAKGLTRLRAIDIYYKRFGDNAPVKQANTDSQGNDVATFVIKNKGIKPVKEGKTV